MTATDRERRSSAGSLLGDAASLLVPLGVLEVLAFAPLGQWAEPAVWVAQALGVAVLVALVATAGWILARLGDRLGRPGAGRDAVVFLSILLLLHAHLRHPADRLGGFLGGSGADGLALVALAAAVAFAAWKLSLARRQAWRAPAATTLVALLAPAVGLTALRRAAIVEPGFATRPAVLAGFGLYLAALAAVAWPARRRRAAWPAAATVAGLVALRLLVPNPHQLRVERPAAAPAAPAAAAVEGPPVLLIVLDTMRADALDLSAPPAQSRTPALARFARRADVHRGAIANASWSLPGHASLFTGLTVSGHRTDALEREGFSNRLPADLPTAHELFARGGYRTACVTANTLVSKATGLARGCQSYVAPGAHWIFATSPFQTARLKAPAGRQWILLQLLQDIAGLDVHPGAGRIVDHALTRITGAPRPLYLFLNFMDVHFPHPAVEGEPPRRRLELLIDDLGIFLHGYGRLPERLQRHRETLLRRYLHEARVLDRELGRLFDALRRRGWFDRMLIVVTSDHGEAMGENRELGLYFGHHGAWEPVVRIPLLVKRPGQRRGRTFTHPVQQTDVLPALLELAGLPPRDDRRSRLLDPDLDLPVVTEWYRPTQQVPMHPRDRVALYRGPYKLVAEDDGRGGARELFLFDLDRSPWEAVDASDRLPALVRALDGELEALLERHRREAPAPPPVDPRVQEQLEALGYAS